MEAFAFPLRGLLILVLPLIWLIFACVVEAEAAKVKQERDRLKERTEDLKTSLTEYAQQLPGRKLGNGHMSIST